MQSRGAAGQQRFALSRGELDAELRDRLRIVTERFELRQQGRREGRAADPGEPLDLFGVQDRQDAGCDRHAHAERLHEVVAEPEVVVVVEEELGEDDIGAVVDFCLQTLPVDVFPFRAGDVALREAGGADREAAHLFDERHELIRIVEAALRPRQLAADLRGIAAQGEDVPDPLASRL